MTVFSYLWISNMPNRQKNWKLNLPSYTDNIYIIINVHESEKSLIRWPEVRDHIHVRDGVGFLTIVFSLRPSFSISFKTPEPLKSTCTSTCFRTKWHRFYLRPLFVLENAQLLLLYGHPEMHMNRYGLWQAKLKKMTKHSFTFDKFGLSTAKY